MRMRDAQFGDVFDRDDALRRGHASEQRRKEGGLARARRTRHEQVRALRHKRLEPRAGGGIEHAPPAELVEVGNVDVGQADRDRRPRAGHRRQHGVHAGAVLPAHVDERRAVIEVSTSDADEGDGERAQLVGTRPPPRHRLDAAAAVDEQPVGAVDEHVGHGRIGEHVAQRREGGMIGQFAPRGRANG